MLENTARDRLARGKLLIGNPGPRQKMTHGFFWGAEAQAVFQRNPTAQDHQTQADAQTQAMNSEGSLPPRRLLRKILLLLRMKSLGSSWGVTIDTGLGIWILAKQSASRSDFKWFSSIPPRNPPLLKFECGVLTIRNYGIASHFRVGIQRYAWVWNFDI